MGADYKGQEKGVEEVKKLGAAGRGYLAHHLRNSLSSVITLLEVDDVDAAKQAAWHMVDDLERVGL